MSEKALKFDIPYIDSLEYTRPAAEDFPPQVTLFGDPTITELKVAGPDGPGQVVVWTCDKDGFDYAPIPEAEAAFLLEGRLRATSVDGEVTEVVAGEGYRLPAGWAGRIEAVEPVRKVFFLLG